MNLWLIILLAVVQGLLEWLPVSSEGQLILILNWLGESETALSIALFLHLGTMLAVIIKFRKDFLLLFNYRLSKEKAEKIEEEELEAAETKNLKADPKEKNSEKESSNSILIQKEQQKQLWKFLLWSTLMTTIVGVPLFILVRFALEEGALLEIAGGVMNSGDIITMAIGLFLIITGIFIIFSRKRIEEKPLLEMNTKEMILVGIAQGITIIPGVSRSGTTVGTMLLEGIDEQEALRGSFLLSVPAILGANILTVFIDVIQGELSFGGIPWYGIILGIAVSAIVGYLTIDALLWIARKVNFGIFCIIIGSLALLITVIIILLNVTT
ncbi:MAG: hypothetical protein GF308_15705 [Candidatus Heimdallarchaeota archaeon]|nr:hypothetical protein [Candidatus Heimdallarchaeota archaeon]